MVRQSPGQGDSLDQRVECGRAGRRGYVSSRREIPAIRSVLGGWGDSILSRCKGCGGVNAVGWFVERQLTLSTVPAGVFLAYVDAGGPHGGFGRLGAGFILHRILKRAWTNGHLVVRSDGTRVVVDEMDHAETTPWDPESTG